MWSQWMEAFSVGKADAMSVVKILVNHIIPRWGIPAKLSSDNATHFRNEVLDKLVNRLDTDIRKHCAYHPQSAGTLERANGTLKDKLKKIMEATGLKWVKALLLALMQIRAQKGPTGLSPFEIICA